MEGAALTEVALTTPTYIKKLHLKYCPDLKRLGYNILECKGKLNMARALEKMHTPTDWYDDVCQQLDHLQSTASLYTDKDEIIPPNSLFREVKEKLKSWRQLAGFPSLRFPDVCLSPNGDICLTWDSGKRSFDLIFGSTFTARLTTGFKQTILDPKDVPLTLRQFVTK